MLRKEPDVVFVRDPTLQADAFVMMRSSVDFELASGIAAGCDCV